MTEFKRLKIGVSECLLGSEVRFNGGHKRDAYIVDLLGKFVDYVPICPEVGIGLGVPREPIRIVLTEDKQRVVNVNDYSVDHTDALRDYSKVVMQQLTKISGYIVKSQSPTCGMERVKIYQGKGSPLKKGVGIFTQELCKAFPLLPVEEEGRLKDPVLRENFVERIYAFGEWQDLLGSELTYEKLIAFHRRHKYSLMSHNVAGYKRLGNIIASGSKQSIDATAKSYIEGFMRVMKRNASIKRHTNVLMHLMGYLKKQLSSEDKAELIDIITAYHQRQVPLVVPITMLRHYYRKYSNEYILEQSYLSPHPDQLMLRNFT